MAWVTAAEVKASINFPTTGSPVSDEAINRFILDAQDEIEKLFNTKFGNVEDSGTAGTAFTSITLGDSSKTWTADQFEDYVLWIYSGTGKGQYREIIENGTSILTVGTAFVTTPDATSKYRITSLGWKEDLKMDGTGVDTQFVEHFPLIDLHKLFVDSTKISGTAVYQYEDSGKLVLKDSASKTIFSNNYPQLIDFYYTYGVYPIPRVIKRLCTVLAGMRTVAAKVSGSYTDFATISLPGGISGSKGQPYVNLQAGIREMRLESENIIKSYGPFIYVV